MKKTYIFSFLLCLLFFGCVYFGSYYFVTEYITEPITEEYISIVENNPDGNDNTGSGNKKFQETVLADTNEEMRIDSYTKYVLETYDITNYELHEEAQPMPSEYIGLTREGLITYLEEYEKYPSEADQLTCLVDIQLISFSDSKVVIRKSFKPEEIPETFYLMVENNMVNVYYKDKKTIYMYTDIALDTLPEEIQNEIIKIKYIRSPKELYNFLETYSS